MAEKEKEPIRIRLDLEGVDAKMFFYVKRRKGVKNNTEVVRVLINEAYTALGGKELL